MNSLLMSAQESSAAAPTVANHNTKTVFRYIDVLGDHSHTARLLLGSSRPFEQPLLTLCVCLVCVGMCVCFFLKNVSFKLDNIRQKFTYECKVCLN